MKYLCTGLAAPVLATSFLCLPVWGQAAEDRVDGERAEGMGDEASGRGTPAGHAHVRPFHGGQVAMTDIHHFETVFSHDGVRVYLYTADQTPLMVERARGVVTLKFADGTKENVPLVLEAPSLGEGGIFFCPKHEEVVHQEPGVCGRCGGTRLYQQDRLLARADLANVTPGSLQAIVHVTGLAGVEKDARFTATLTKAMAPRRVAEATKSEPRTAEGIAETVPR